jgi:transposase
MEKTIIKKKRRKYDESFKEELLKMVKSGRSVAEVSRTMGIGENLLYKWKSEEKSQETPAETIINLEIEQLRKQLRQVEIERDILKKLWSFSVGGLNKNLQSH